jgi:hypothetical protein
MDSQQQLTKSSVEGALLRRAHSISYFAVDRMYVAFACVRI